MREETVFGMDQNTCKFFIITFIKNFTTLHFTIVLGPFRFFDPLSYRFCNNFGDLAAKGFRNSNFKLTVLRMDVACGGPVSLER